MRVVQVEMARGKVSEILAILQCAPNQWGRTSEGGSKGGTVATALEDEEDL